MAIPCRPQKTFTLFVLDVPDDLPVEDVRHSLYRFNSVVEVVRLIVHYPVEKATNSDGGSGGGGKIEIEKKKKFPLDLNFCSLRNRCSVCIATKIDQLIGGGRHSE